MPKFVAMVEVEADTIEQARIVLIERVYFDEQYEDEDGERFDYKIDVVEGPVEKVT